MCTCSKGHSRIDFDNFVTLLRLVFFPGRFDDDRVRNSGRFEILFPAVFPVIVADQAIFDSQTSVNSLRIVLFQLCHCSSDFLNLMHGIFVGFHVNGDIRFALSHQQNFLVNIIPVVLIFLFQEIVYHRRIFRNKSIVSQHGQNAGQRFNALR